MNDEARAMASTAPIDSRVPGSPEWCYQTANLMRMNWEGLTWDRKRFSKYLAELRLHKAWMRIPVERPYGSEAEMLKHELGFEGNIDHATDRRAESEMHALQLKAAGEKPTLRAIAKKTGVSHETVRNNLSRDPLTDYRNGKRTQFIIRESTQPETAAEKIHAKFGPEFAQALKEAL